jgi:hypothetical protein
VSNAKETLLFLANFNSWRRGNDDAVFPDPAEVGAAIDDAVNLLRRYDDTERENVALRADKERLARWIVYHSNDVSGDHACAECFPNSEIIKKGFRCAVHISRSALDVARKEQP